MARRHLVAGVLFHNSRNRSGGALEDGICRSSGNPILQCLGFAIELTHLELTNTAMTVACVMHTFLMVLATLNSFTRKLSTVVISDIVALLLPPVSDDLEQLATSIADAVVAHLALGGMMHNAIDDTVQETVNISVIIIDGIHQLRNNPVDHLGRSSTSDFVQDLGNISMTMRDIKHTKPNALCPLAESVRIQNGLKSTHVGEVILGQHGVCGVSATIIVEHDVLLLLAALDDFIRASLELIADLMDERNNERRNDGKDEFGQLLFKLLNNLGEERDLLYCSSDGFHHVIVELNRRQNLVEDVLHVDCELLGIPGRNTHVLNLRRGSVGLDLINPVALVLIAEKPIWDFVEKLSEEAGVGILAFFQGSFKLINLILGQLVGD